MGQLEDLRLLVTVIQSQGITRAADRLNIAKSAVSRRLSALEERYGARLLERGPGVWDVTAAGEEIYERALQLIGEADEIEADFAHSQQSLAGPLAVSVAHEFGQTCLMGALIDFTERHPEIVLSVDFEDRRVDLLRENYDFAIRITEHVDDSVIAQKMGTCRHELYASADYLAAYGTPTSLAELRDHRLLHYGHGRRGSWAIQSEGGPETFTFQPTLNANSGLFLLQAARRGKGIARLPDFVAAGSIAEGELVRVLPELRLPDWGVYLLHAAERRMNRRMRLFAAEIAGGCFGR